MWELTETMNAGTWANGGIPFGTGEETSAPRWASQSRDPQRVPRDVVWSAVDRIIARPVALQKLVARLVHHQVFVVVYVAPSCVR